MVIQKEESLKLPPLENGDRLTRDEFERRYQAMPNVKKAELIEGKVYMPSPVRAANHGRPHAQIITWLGVYCVATPGTDLIDNGTTRIDLDNEPQPDALLRIDTAGQSYISDDDYVEGAPELIVEIAASSASYDLYEKLNVYRRNGVQEYIVWQTYDKKLSWFKLRGQEYITLEPDADGSRFMVSSRCPNCRKFNKSSGCIAARNKYTRTYCFYKSTIAAKIINRDRQNTHPLN